MDDGRVIVFEELVENSAKVADGTDWLGYY